MTTSAPSAPPAASARRHRHAPCFSSVALPVHSRPALAPASSHPAVPPSPRRRPAPLTMVAANPLPPSTRSNISRTKPVAHPSSSPAPSGPSASAKTATKKRPLPTATPSSSSSSSHMSSRVSADRRGMRLTDGVMRDARFTLPVPDAEPHEIEPARRGRNAQRRARYAEHFRRYLYLRKLLKPWSESFRARHGRTPSLVDVHDSDVPGLFDRFVEYLEALDGLRVDG